MTTIQQFKILFKDKLDHLDLELIIADSIKKSREFVLAHPEFSVKSKQESVIRKNIERRIKHEPLAYILDHKEFFGLDFSVNKNVLVPRPETEQLVEQVMKKAKRLSASFVDVGTGSGNIIISLAKNLKRKNTFYGIDISVKALQIARKNSRRHKVSKKIKFLHGNLLEPVIKKVACKNYFIIANLPYLDNKWKNLLKNSESAGLKFEPIIALEGGKDGLNLYRKIAGQIKILKNKIGNGKIYLFCEIGHLQKNEMKMIFYFAKKVSFIKDLAGKWRVFEAII